MNDLIECIYDCLRYRDYYLDFSKYYNEEYQWYIKNKPTLNFIKINDPEKNYLTIQKHIDEVKEKAAKLNEEHEKELARIPTLTKEQLFKEMDKTGAELKQTIEELKKSAENFSNIQIGNDDEQ